MRDEVSQQEETYEQAVARAGVVQLPDTASPQSRLADLLKGRFEDDNPPGAPQ